MNFQDLILVPRLPGDTRLYKWIQGSKESIMTHNANKSFNSSFIFFTRKFKYSRQNVNFLNKSYIYLEEF